MDTFAALALATDPPSPSILNRKPEPKSAPLITFPMWKMIVGQSIFQLMVTLILYFAGPTMLSYTSQREQLQLPTLVFNTFVWMQIFNQYNNRRLDNKLNIFEGIHRNYFFIGIQFIIIAGQIMIIFVGGAAFSVHRLNTAQWLYSTVLGFLSIPVGVLLRLIPDESIRTLIPKWVVRKAAPKVLVSDEERQTYEWNPALEQIRDELAFMKMLRGGRLNVLKYKLTHPVEAILPRSRSGSFRSRSRGNSPPQTPTGDPAASDSASQRTSRTPESRTSKMPRSPRSRSNSAFGPAVAMMATGVVAGSVAGWSPIGRRSEEGPSRLPHDVRSRLENQEGIDIHPAAEPHDPIVADDPKAKHVPPSQFAETTPAPGSSRLAPPQRAY